MFAFKTDRLSINIDDIPEFLGFFYLFSSFLSRFRVHGLCSGLVTLKFEELLLDKLSKEAVGKNLALRIRYLLITFLS